MRRQKDSVPIQTSCLAIIPARGGSKGIPRKNLLLVGGLPLVTCAIRTARAAHQVTRVVVSTDDMEIAAVAEGQGAGVVRRPPELSGDDASSESALLHALEHLAMTEKYHPELLVFLQCTAPLTLPADVDAAVAMLIEKRADTVFTASPFHGFVWRENPEGEALAVNHEKSLRPRRQDRSAEFLENGAVYVMRVAGFLEARHRFFGKTVMCVMPKERSLDIDEAEDLERAEAFLSRKIK